MCIRDRAYHAPAATSADLHAASVKGAKVIILIAHWRGNSVLGVDLRPGFMDALRQTAPDIAAEISALMHDPSNDNPTIVAHAVDQWVKQDPSLQVDRRTLLEDSAPANIVPGNCLELRNGYRKAYELEMQLAPGWGGVLELCVCHSEELALTLEDGRRDRHAITNAIAKIPARILPELREALLFASLAPIPYVQRRVEIMQDYRTRYLTL